VTAPLLLIPIALEWVILVTTLAPVLYPGKKFMRSHPRTALAIWFGTLLSAGIATLLALTTAIWSIYDTWVLLEANPAGSQNWFAALLVSFAPWVLLALGGVSIALINLRIEPMIVAAKDTQPQLGLALKPVMNFMGAEVCEVQLPIALAMANRSQILVSSALRQAATDEQLEAVLWHELAHLKQNHFALKALAAFVRLLSPWLAASKALVAEVHELCEIAADQAALKKVSGPTLRSAHSLFTIL
jgi:Zn-dependent protease with chaperone function